MPCNLLSQNDGRKLPHSWTLRRSHELDECGHDLDVFGQFPDLFLCCLPCIVVRHHELQQETLQRIHVSCHADLRPTSAVDNGFCCLQVDDLRSIPSLRCPLLNSPLLFFPFFQSVFSDLEFPCPFMEIRGVHHRDGSLSGDFVC